MQAPSGDSNNYLCDLHPFAPVCEDIAWSASVLHTDMYLRGRGVGRWTWKGDIEPGENLTANVDHDLQTWRNALSTEGLHHVSPGPKL